MFPQPDQPQPGKPIVVLLGSDQEQPSSLNLRKPTLNLQS